MFGFEGDADVGGAGVGYLSRRAGPLTALTLLAIILTSLPARSGEWRGWRGGGLQGRSESADIPGHWSSRENILWKTAMPGEGHSSPIVTRDSVYITTAQEVKGSEQLMTLGKLAQLIGLVLVALFAMGSIVRQCADPAGSGRALGSIARASAPALFVVFLSALVFFGETFLDFGRAPERGWTAACLVGMLCLGIGLLSTAPEPRPVRGWGAAFLVLAGVVAISIPDVAHTVAENAISAVSLFIYWMISLPALVGFYLLWRSRSDAATSQTRRTGFHVARALVWLVVAIWLVLPVIMVARGPRGTISVGIPHIPGVRLWMVVTAAGIFALSLEWRRRRGWSLLANLAVVIGTVVFGLVAIAAIGDQLLARLPYLSYLLGRPIVHPMLGRTALLSFIGICVLALVFYAALESRRRTRATTSGLPVAVSVSAVFLAAACFAYANFMFTTPHLERSIVGVARDTGAIRWISEGLPGQRGEMNSDNSPATPTAVTDGRRVYAYFGTPGVLCVDLTGRTVWKSKRLPFESREGVASSPVLCDGKVIVLSESDAGRCLVALDCESGGQVWRTERNKKTHSYAGNCRTPTVERIGGREVIVVWGFEDVSGYDPATGRGLWSHNVGGFGSDCNPVATAVSDKRSIYLVGPAKTMALNVDKLQGRGSPVAWQRPVSDGAQCSSPVVKDGLLFAVSDNGGAYCIDTRTGRMLWRRELGGQHYSSVVASGDRIYLTSTSGRTTVMGRNGRNQKIGENDLGEQVYASLAPVDGELFIRARQHLHCIRER